MFRNLPPLCKGILVALIASALLSLAIPGIMVSSVPLYSQLALRGLQVWRFVSYPFFVLASARGLLSALFTLLWIGFIVAIFGGELETIVHTKRLTIALAATVVIGGLIFSFLSPDGALAGPGIITMFLLGGFAYLWPKREISLFGLLWVKAWVIALAVFILSVIPMTGMRLDTSAANLFGPVFGVLGAIVYFHIAYRQYSFGRAFLTRMEDVFSRRASKRPVPLKGGDENSPRMIEAHIDAILDKIASHGMQSLSKDEREFLLKHSK